MAHQDYVKRPRAPKKKNNPYKKSKDGGNAHQSSSQGNSQVNSAVKNKLIVVIILIIIGATSYGLWLLKNAPKTKEPIQTVIPKSTEKQTKSLPKPPKEKWAYRDALENKEIEVGEYQVEQGGPYKMQCGSFKTLKQAEVLKATIAFSGLEAKIQQTQGKNGTWYKVVLGPYERKRVAEKDKHQLKNNSVNRCQIWLWK